MDSISTLRAKQERDIQESVAHEQDDRLGYVVGHIQPKENEDQSKKLGGWGFWCIVALAIAKDASDIFLTGTVVLAIISTIVSVFVFCVVTFYFYYNGVSLFVTRKLATYMMTAVIDFIPYLAALPSFTTMVFMIRFLENNELLRKAVEVKESGGSLVYASVQALATRNLRGNEDEEPESEEDLNEFSNNYQNERRAMDSAA